MTRTDEAGKGSLLDRSLSFPVHPLFFALFPVAFLYRRNIEHVPWQDAMRVVLAVALLTIVCTGVILLIFRNAHRAGVVASGLALLLLSYGHVHTRLEHGPLGRDSVLLAIFAVLAVVGVFVATRIKSAGRDITKLLNVASIALFALAAVPAASATVRDVRRGALPSGGVMDVTRNTASTKTAKLRDIIYICPDDYLGPAAMKREIGFDNEPFLRSLEKRGFYIPRQSKANYPSSYFSLATTFSMNYLPRSLDNAKAVNPLLEESSVVSFLRSKGYRFVYMPGWYDQTRIRDHDDITYQYEAGSAFTENFLDTTVVSAFGRSGIVKSADYREVHRQISLFQFRNLPRVRRISGPVFVFAHIILPHSPFVFDAKGRPISREQEKARSLQKNYSDHIKFVNAQLDRVLDGLLSGPEETRPIVLVESEEGIHLVTDPDKLEATPEQLDKPFSMLAAYYTPGVDARKMLYPTISPVNSMRVLLNLYFGTKFPLLPEKYYTWRAPKNNPRGIDFIDITDHVVPPRR